MVGLGLRSFVALFVLIGIVAIGQNQRPGAGLRPHPAGPVHLPRVDHPQRGDVQTPRSRRVLAACRACLVQNLQGLA